MPQAPQDLSMALVPVPTDQELYQHVLRLGAGKSASLKGTRAAIGRRNTIYLQFLTILGCALHYTFEGNTIGSKGWECGEKSGWALEFPVTVSSPFTILNIPHPC